MNPPWGLSACHSACFDWQGLSLCCQAFPHIGNCWRLSAEATSHPWTAAKQRTEWSRIRICRDESILTGRALISYTGGFHMKRAAGVGGSALVFVSVVFTTFPTLANLHGEIYICMASISKSRQPLQQNKLVHTSGMYPSSPVQRVVEKELLHVRGVHSCRVGSLFRPRGKSLLSIISCRETMRRENALTEKKSQLFIWSKLAFNHLMSLDKSLQARLQFYNHEWNCSASFDLRLTFFLQIKKRSGLWSLGLCAELKQTVTWASPAAAPTFSISCIIVGTKRASLKLWLQSLVICVQYLSTEGQVCLKQSSLSEGIPPY